MPTYAYNSLNPYTTLKYTLQPSKKHIHFVKIHILYSSSICVWCMYTTLQSTYTTCHDTYTFLEYLLHHPFKDSGSPSKVMLTLSTRDHFFKEFAWLLHSVRPLDFRDEGPVFILAISGFSAELQHPHDRVASVFADHYIPLWPKVTRPCYYFSSLFCYCFFMYFWLLFCF